MMCSINILNNQRFLLNLLCEYRGKKIWITLNFSLFFLLLLLWKSSIMMIKQEKYFVRSKKFFTSFFYVCWMINNLMFEPKFQRIDSQNRELNKFFSFWISFKILIHQPTHTHTQRDRLRKGKKNLVFFLLNITGNCI